MKKKLLAMLLGMTMVLSMTACTGSNDDSSSSGTSSESSSSGNLLDDVGNALNAQGREYGKTYTIGQNETMSCTFFDLKINSVTKADELNDYVPQLDTDMFIIVNVTITNTFKDNTDPIPMYYSDFQVTYDGLAEPWFAESKFTDGQLPDEYYLAQGESATGDFVFIVDRNGQNMKFLYVEYWNDDFEGNTYEILLDPIA